MSDARSAGSAVDRVRLHTRAMVATVLARATRSPRWWSAAGRARRRLGDDRGTLDAFARARDLQPDDAAAWLQVGRAAERLQRHDDAMHAYRTAIALGERSAAPHLGLARLLEHTGADGEALDALEAALALAPDNVQVRRRAARLAARLGDDARLVDALQALLADGDDDGRLRLQLAQRLDASGRWQEAADELRTAIARMDGGVDGAAPDADVRRLAALHRLLGDVLLRLDRWGGNLGTDPATGRQVLHPLVGDPGEQGGWRRDAEVAYRRALELQPDRPGMRAAIGLLLEEAGRPEAAVPLYEEAVEAARATPRTWGYRALHRWQFALERARAAAGTPRVEDPLLDGAITLGDEVDARDRQAAVGLLDARFTYYGLQVEGILLASSSDRVDLLLDGEVLRSVTAGGRRDAPTFTFTVRRDTLDHLPPRAVLTARTAEGALLLVRGRSSACTITLPHGSSALTDRLRSGETLDKKGSLRISSAEARARQDAYLALYDRARDYFATRLTRPLLLLYGTLLGHHRDGDLIPGDDDFDVGYLSEAGDPATVKRETLELIGQLTRDGWTVSFNRRGRLFRLADDHCTLPDLHLDVRPLWFEDGRVWLHNHASFPSEPERFHPPAPGELRGTPVLAPRDTEHFLRAHYGPGWKTPDPGFTYHASEIDPAIRSHLAKALLTPGELRVAHAALHTEDPAAAARFVSVGLHDLYPLSDLVR